MTSWKGRSHASPASGELGFGICTSAKRFQKPYFTYFLSVLREMRKIRVYEMTEDLVNSVAVEDWPLLDCLLVIYSPKLHLERILQYVDLRRPYLVNDVHTQYLLRDRRLICLTLEQHGISAPPYWLLSPEDDVREFDDHLAIEDVSIVKPFIEKPLDTEDHALAIYYTSETGRGCTLLGKENDVRTCEYLRGENRRRRNREYLYQPFLQTDGFDIKVYAVGTEYFHAEAKKSPVINSLKNGNSDKKYPVMLTAEEKELAIKIVRAFSQNVVTFDVIRCQGKSYVVDVNTGNIVKGPDRAIMECAKMLGMHVLQALKRIENDFNPQRAVAEEPNQTSYRQEHLCAVVAILRHGDRTPKQKVKYKTSNPLFLSLFEKPKELKLKRHEDLVQLLETTRTALREDSSANNQELETIRDVLEQGLDDDYTPKAQMKPMNVDESGLHVTRALLIVKWGGTLTHAGITQCEATGRHFRTAYYQDDAETFHRLHSTYEHDIKCYSSSEGRCQKSAGAFLRGFLDLDSDINAVATCMVRKDEPVVKMLDESPPAAEGETTIKTLTQLLNSEEPLIDALRQYHEELPKALLDTASAIGNPRRHLNNIRTLLAQLLTHLEEKLKTVESRVICGNESHHLIHQRWQAMCRSFYQSSTEKFVIGRIPALNDCIRYDILHNKELVGDVGRAILDSTIFLSKLVSNLEYGFTLREKHLYCSEVIERLMRKILADLRFWTSAEVGHPEELIGDQNYHWYRPVYKHTRSRFYFTSLSHLNSILATVTLKAKKWSLKTQGILDQIMSLEYLGHFVLKLYEDQQRGAFDPKRYRGELWLSPGVDLSNLEAIEQHTAPVVPAVMLHCNLKFSDLEELFGSVPDPS